MNRSRFAKDTAPLPPLRRLALLTGLCAVALGLMAAPALARIAYTLDYTAGTATPIDTATNQAGTPFPVGPQPYSAAILPSGAAMYVADTGDDTLRVIGLPGGQELVAPIALGGDPATVAISPDGKTVYVTDDESSTLHLIDTQTNQAAAPIALPGKAWGVAFSPSGQLAYVTLYDANEVVVVDTQTRQVVGTPIPVGEDPINITLTPDGAFAYVTNYDADTVSVIDTQTGTVVATIPVGDGPWGVTITPGGTRAYVANYESKTVSVIDTQTRQVVGTPIPVGEGPYEIAITPDGKTAYVVNYESESVTVIDIATNQPVATIPVAGGPWQILMTPDQSPLAGLKVGGATAGKATRFNGEGSTDSDGLIASFNWSFGDGKAATTTVAKTSHKYKKAKAYSAALTVTDNEGCSAAMVFTGRTAYCSGAAAATAKVKVKAPNAFSFGKLAKNPAKGTATLKVKLPYAGTVKLWGKGVKAAKRHAGKAKTVSLAVKPQAQLLKALAADGSAKVKLKVKFKPDGGKARTKPKTVQLVLR